MEETHCPNCGIDSISWYLCVSDNDKNAAHPHPLLWCHIFTFYVEEAKGLPRLNVHVFFSVYVPQSLWLIHKEELNLGSYLVVLSKTKKVEVSQKLG